MTPPRRARVRERMLTMLAIGFCLGSLATTWLTWRRDALGFGARATQPVAARTPESADEAGAALPREARVVRTEPAVGPAALPPARFAATAAASTDLEILRERPLRIPVDGVTPAELLPSFDSARGAGPHEAIDILAPRGTPVRAVEAGTVARLFTSARGGTTVYQFDPDGTYCYYYAHLDRYADGLEEGDEVEAGEILGYVGTTGNAPPRTPHLHFAIFRMTEEGRWWEGTPIDPYLVLR